MQNRQIKQNEHYNQQSHLDSTMMSKMILKEFLRKI